MIGALLLLLRRKLAYTVLLISFLCMVVTSIHNYGFSNGVEVSGTVGVVFSAIIFVWALFMVLYSRAMAGRGVLS